MNPVNIIGIGQGREDLTSNHHKLIHECDILVGGKRQLGLFDYSDKQKVFITGPLKRVIESIKEKMRTHKIVVLASGDPLFYGIGSTLTQHFEKQHLRFHSNISSISAAFAAIKEPWHDAKIISLHGKQKESFLFESLAKDKKVAFLTDPHMHPQYIAAGMIKAGLTCFKCCVLENLGDKNLEKIRWFDNLDNLDDQHFFQPNIVILQKSVDDNIDFSHETHIGMDDSLFSHSKGLITKSEVRCVSLSKLKLTNKNHVMWDIGSGSGSISVEASIQIPLGKVFAIEKNPERIDDINHNIKRFNCHNIEVVKTAFPKGIKTLTTPDRILIGGGGENLDKIITVSCQRLAPCGILVVNTVLLQSLETSLRILKKLDFDPKIVQIHVSKSKGMPYGDRLEALNPVWIITGVKPKKGEINEG